MRTLFQNNQNPHFNNSNLHSRNISRDISPANSFVRNRSFILNTTKSISRIPQNTTPKNQIQIFRPVNPSRSRSTQRITLHPNFNRMPQVQYNTGQNMNRAPLKVATPVNYTKINLYGPNTSRTEPPKRKIARSKHENPSNVPKKAHENIRYIKSPLKESKGRRNPKGRKDNMKVENARRFSELMNVRMTDSIYLNE